MCALSYSCTSHRRNKEIVCAPRREERCVERGSARRSDLTGRGLPGVVSQTYVGTVFLKKTSGKLLREVVGRICAFAIAYTSSWTELNCTSTRTIYAKKKGRKRLLVHFFRPLRGLGSQILRSMYFVEPLGHQASSCTSCQI